MLKAHWPEHLPQPFIGFDDVEGTFIAEWHAQGEYNTLEFYADGQTGEYVPYPGSVTAELEEVLNLDSEDTWELLKTALTTTRA